MGQPTNTGHYRRRLDKLPSEELFEMAEQVADLQKHPGFGVVSTLLEEGRANMIELLVKGGGVKSKQEFANQTGLVAGLEELGNVVKAIEEAAALRRDKLQKEADAEREAREEQP